ncbi:hypothetical protein QZM97_02700 [Burkholderia orbicola]|uniref:hypothetical protein n=1 Tax=Burkholderia orbicola TaxID=2978683 RepID=UPI002651B9CF|nr:hypothetical protein [Burkholderia orbicola]MDN7988979.1 hypothetical protein [Burkholderia orbicola]
MKITDDMLTEWFPHRIKPMHEGIYETIFRGAPNQSRLRLWNGARWMYLDDPQQICVFQDCDWRGLKEKHHG